MDLTIFPAAVPEFERRFRHEQAEPGAIGRSRGERKVLVVGAVEVLGAGCGRVRLSPAETANADDLQPFVADNVRKARW
jgi:hypothetical protein